MKHSSLTHRVSKWKGYRKTAMRGCNLFAIMLFLLYFTKLTYAKLSLKHFLHKDTLFFTSVFSLDRLWLINNFNSNFLQKCSTNIV